MIFVGNSFEMGSVALNPEPNWVAIQADEDATVEVYGTVVQMNGVWYTSGNYEIKHECTH